MATAASSEGMSYRAISIFAPTPNARTAALPPADIRQQSTPLRWSLHVAARDFCQGAATPLVGA